MQIIIVRNKVISMSCVFTFVRYKVAIVRKSVVKYSVISWIKSHSCEIKWHLQEIIVKYVFAMVREI